MAGGPVSELKDSPYEKKTGVKLTTPGHSKALAMALYQAVKKNGAKKNGYHKNG